MVELKVLCEDTDVPTSIFEIRSKEGTITSPLRGISKYQREYSKKLKEGNYIIEVHHYLSSTMIKSISLSSTASERFNRRITSKMIKGKLHLFVFDLTEGYPSKREELENLLHVLNFESIVNDNLICLPFSSSTLQSLDEYEKIYNILENKADDLMEILSTFVIKQRNILGYVPIFCLGGKYIEKLITLYEKANINSFLFDLGGKHIERFRGQISQLIKVRRNLMKEYGYTFFYAFNTFSGRVSKKIDVIPARDFLSIFVGFDGFGPSHKRYKLPKEIAESLILKEKRFRLFDEDEYVYRLYNKEEVRKITSHHDPQIGCKIYNAAHQTAELDKIKAKIKEENTYLRSLEKKETVFPILSNLLDIRKESLLNKKLFI